jgi:hypothetical protein
MRMKAKTYGINFLVASRLRLTFEVIKKEPRIEHNTNDETQEENSKKDEMEVKEEQEEKFDEDQECVEEHEDIVNLEKTLLKKMKTFAANKPKKVVRRGGPSPLKRGKKLKPKPILKWVSIATTKNTQ